RDRLHRLREQIEAGSPRPEFELSFDPLGLIAPALKPFAESTIIEQEQPLTSADRTMRVFLVVTNQQSISAFECQRLMREVNKFRAIAAEGWNPESHSGLQVLVTGRSAFASEIALSMRYDVVATLLGSVLLVGTIFFVGFRRWLPLLGMALCLLLSCLVALTLGQLLFGRLSMISVGFCAILVGLGVDFAILTIGRYHQARSDGEPQRQAIPHDWLFEGVRKYVRWIVRKPVPMLLFSTVVLLVLTAIGFSPNPPLHFETNTRSLQPRNIRASQALEAIMHEMPVRWEPVLAIVRSANPQELHDYWQKIVAHWRELQAAGKIKGFSTPAALCLSPDWMETNRRQLSAINFPAARETLDQTLDSEGFSRDSFAPALTLLDNLQRLTDPNVPLPNWRDQLPKPSSWW